MNTETSVRQALQDLLEITEPSGLADRALRVARRRPWRRLGSGALIAVMVALIVIVTHNFLSGSPAHDGTRPGNAPCVMYTSGSNGQPNVPREQWPDIVTEVVRALPERTDYWMQSGYAWCTSGSGSASAYAVINHGAGHLTLTVLLGTTVDLPMDCSDVAPESPLTLLFCDNATAVAPLIFGVGAEDYSRVTAIYADGVVFELESYGLITADQLRVAALDPRVYATIPLGGGTPTQ